jgi:hypothetical protein
MTRPAGSLRVSIFTRVRDPSLPRPKRKRAPARPRAAVVASLRDAPVYALRRPDGTDLVVSRGLLGCLYGAVVHCNTCLRAL